MFSFILLQIYAAYQTHKRKIPIRCGFPYRRVVNLNNIKSYKKAICTHAYLRTFFSIFCIDYDVIPILKKYIS